MDPLKSSLNTFRTYKNQVQLKKKYLKNFKSQHKTLIFCMKALAAFAASLSFYVTGEVRGWASPAVPSLQGFNGLNDSLSYAPLSKEAASWISKSILEYTTKNFRMSWIFWPRGPKNVKITFLFFGVSTVRVQSYCLIFFFKQKCQDKLSFYRFEENTRDHVLKSIFSLFPYLVLDQ